MPAASEKDKKKKELEKLRREKGFLPQYAECYFVGGQGTRSLCGCFLLYAAMLMGLRWLSDRSAAMGILWIVIVVTAVMLLCGVEKIKERKKRFGYRLLPDRIVKIGAHGKETAISYRALDAAIAAGSVYYGATGLVIDLGADKICFHYEVGSSENQKHIEECYKELEPHLKEKLPPFDTGGIELLDKKYFYEKTRRKQMLSLALATLFFAVVCLGFWPLGKVLFSTAIILPWECTALHTSMKSVVLFEKNQEKIREKLGTAKIRGIDARGSGYIIFAVTAALVVLVNIQCILNFV